MKGLLTPLMAVVAGVVLLAPARTQGFEDLMLVRNRPQPFRSYLQTQIGLRGAFAESSGQPDKLAGDGFLFYHTRTQGRSAYDIDTYAGRDGFYLGMKDHLVRGQKTQGRIEFFGRLFPFYREAFYEGANLVPRGRYEGQDWGVRLSTSRAIERGLRVEGGAFYRQYTFDRSDQTEVDFTIPDGFITYGGMVTVEQNSLVLGKANGLPEQGYLATLRVTREQNTSDRVWGVTGGFRSELPSGVWRFEGHLELYYPSGDLGTWEFTVDTTIADEEDRIQAFRAEQPAGHFWVDSTLGLRLGGDTFFITPYAQVQWTRTLNELGTGSTDRFWAGGGVRSGLSLGDNIALVADYSYLSNPFRPPVSFSEDTFGEQQLFIGLDITFGAQR